MKSTTIIPTPSWGVVLAAFQEKGTIRIDTPSSDTFKKLLDAINTQYTTEEDGENLTRFTLVTDDSTEEITKVSQKILDLLKTKTNSIISHNDIEFITLECNKEGGLTLRGQPTNSSPMGVVRTRFKNDKWEVYGSYIFDAIFNLQDDWNMSFEGTLPKMLYLHSKSKGWIEVDPNGNEHYTTGVHPSWPKDKYYSGPNDIDKVMFE